MADRKFMPAFDAQKLIDNVRPELKTLFEQYREGSLQLCVWRNSTPHNWWLSKLGDRNDIVYHWDGYCQPGGEFFAFSCKLPSDGPRVSYGGWMRGSDEGMPRADTWVYDTEMYSTARDRWQQAVSCAKSFNDQAGTRHRDVFALSYRALLNARWLKRLGRFEMNLSDCESVEELVGMGLAQVSPEGYCHRTEALSRQRIPLESRMKFRVYENGYAQHFEPSLVLTADEPNRTADWLRDRKIYKASPAGKERYYLQLPAPSNQILHQGPNLDNWIEMH